MRILIVTQYFHPESFRVTDLAVGLVERGYDVTVLTGMPNYPSGKLFTGYHFWSLRRERYQGVEVIRVPLITRGSKNSLRLFLNYLSFALMASLIGPFRCRGRFDIIFVAQYSPVFVGLPAILLKFIKKAPLYWWVQDLWPESLSATGVVTNNIILGFIDRLVRWMYRRCDKILVQSMGFIEAVARSGVQRSAIVYFPNWAEDVYQGGTTVDESVLKKIPSGFIVMFAGNVGAAQDFGTILSAAEILKHHKDIHIVVLGDGRMRAWVDAQILERGLSDTMHCFGRFPMEWMPAFFKRADAMLVTLKKEPIFALTVPGKIQSYLASAKPIIAALDGEGGRVVEESHSGIVVPSEDARALADAIARIHNMPPEERDRLGDNGHRYYNNHFARTYLLDQLEALIHSSNI